MFWIIALLIIAILIMYYFIDKANEKRKRQNILIQTEQNINNVKIDIENMTDEEYKKKLLQQLQSINMNLVELQFELNKQKDIFKEIKSSINNITFILILPILIGIIIFLLKAKIGYNILQDLTDSFNSTPTATVYVTDDEGNIIYNEEYHGQNVAVPAK